MKKQEKAYQQLFYIENTIRVAMHNSLIKKIGIDYFHEKYFPPYEYKAIVGPDRKINIVNDAKIKKSFEKKYNIALGYDYPYLWYLDFSILVSMIDVYADYFLQIFSSKNAMEELLTRLKNLNTSRNAIAHNRYISTIDMSDIESVYNILNKIINKSIIYNYEDITFNSIEGLLDNYKLLIRELREQIILGNHVSNQMLNRLKSNFSAIIYLVSRDDCNLFDLFIELVSKYNRLSRKPGCYDEIKNFIDSNNILDRLDRLYTIDLGGHYDS